MIYLHPSKLLNTMHVKNSFVIQSEVEEISRSIFLGSFHVLGTFIFADFIPWQVLYYL